MPIMIVKRVDLLKPLECEWSWSWPSPWPCSSEALCSWLCSAIVDSRYWSNSSGRIIKIALNVKEEGEREEIIIWQIKIEEKDRGLIMLDL